MHGNIHYLVSFEDVLITSYSYYYCSFSEQLGVYTLINKYYKF
jgi:hypothetical protein